MKKVILIIAIFFVIVGVVGLLGTLLSNNQQGSGVVVDSNNIPVDFHTMSYVAFGDSITYGSDSSNSYAQLQYPYPTLVGNNLGLSTVTNRGSAGATFCDGIDGLTSITNIIDFYSGNADIVTVLGGTNDYYMSAPLGAIGDTSKFTVYGALDTIGRILSRKYPNAFIVFITPYKNEKCGVNGLNENAAGYTLLDVVEAIEYTARKYKFALLDLYTYGKYERVEMLTPSSDGIHPSQSFVTNYTTPQITRFIRENYNK